VDSRNRVFGNDTVEPPRMKAVRSEGEGVAASQIMTAAPAPAVAADGIQGSHGDHGPARTWTVGRAHVETSVAARSGPSPAMGQQRLGPPAPPGRAEDCDAVVSEATFRTSSPRSSTAVIFDARHIRAEFMGSFRKRLSS